MRRTESFAFNLFSSLSKLTAVTKNTLSSRQVALTCLCRWHEGRGFAETLVDRECERAGLSTEDRHLTQALVFGVLRHRSRLDHFIDTLRQGKLDKKARLILQLGLCQLFILQLAGHAAVFETVNLAPAKLRGLVNAILRSAQRREKELLDANLPLHLQYSTPKWLVERWIEQFGPEQTTELLRWNNTTPHLYVRANPLRPLNALPDGLSPLDRAPGWYRIDGPLPLPEIKAGSLYVADPSTRYAIQLLNPAPGEHILDACAAPGGKSAAIMAATMGQANLTATDLHDYRLPALEENLAACGVSGIRTAQMDWTHPCPAEWQAHFDAVLLDVPCSNTGVIQRRVDVRWRLSAEEITRLTELQKTILTQAAQSVKPGGRLVYSTCSIDTQEDGLLVRQFIADHPEWTLKEEKLILPQAEKSDGAYAALLIRA